MPWIDDNLEAELSGISERGLSDSEPKLDQTITTLNADSAPPSSHDPDDETNQELKEEAQNNCDDGTDKAALKPIDPIDLFVENVSIAGLLEAYNAKWKTDRIMFRVALIMAFCAIAQQSYGIALQYMDVTPVFVDMEQVNQRAPFPNISFCLPSSRINKTRLKESIILSKQVIRLMKTYSSIFNKNFTKDDIIEFIDAILNWGVGEGDFDDLDYQIVRRAFREMAESAQKEGRNVWDFFFPLCSEVLSNCKFNGIPFNCCEITLLYPLRDNACYQIVASRKTQVMEYINTDPPQLAKIGLTFHINLDRTMARPGLDDGYYMSINQLPSPFFSPNPISNTMDVIVHLAEPQKMELKSDCIPLNAIPKLEFFPFYDSDGVQCQLNLIQKLVMKFMDCTVPIGSDYNSNFTCMFEQFYLTSMLLDYGYEPKKAIIGARRKRSTSESTEQQVFSTLSFIGGRNSPCKPLCTRWTYPVFSISYGLIQYRDKNLEQRELTNRSWSSVRIVLPESSRSHVEGKQKSQAYLALCDISGIMGVYAGFSMITFAQVLAYGIYILWAKVKKRVIRVAPEEAAVQESEV